jgi:hypothetical protein
MGPGSNVFRICPSRARCAPGGAGILAWGCEGKIECEPTLAPQSYAALGAVWDDEPIRPMTLGSMRWHGIRGSFVTCQHCGHERAVTINEWPDDATVPSFGPRMPCSCCSNARRDGCSQ